jgi:hypothetical protein
MYFEASLGFLARPYLKRENKKKRKRSQCLEKSDHS